MSLLDTLMNLQLPSFALTLPQLGMLAVGAAVLLYPLLPLKSMLPAVYLHQVKEARDAQA